MQACRRLVSLPSLAARGTQATQAHTLLLNRGMRMKIGRPSVGDKVPIFGASGKITMRAPQLNSEVGRFVEKIVDQEMSPVEVTLTDAEIQAEFNARREEIDAAIDQQLTTMREYGWFDRAPGREATEEEKKRITDLQNDVKTDVETEKLTQIVKEMMSSKLFQTKEEQSKKGVKREVPAKLAQIEKEVTFFSRYLESQQEVRKLLRESTPDGVKNVLTFVFGEMEKKLAPATQEVILQVMTKDSDDRVGTFAQVADLLGKQIAYETRTLACDIISSGPLEESQRTRVLKALNARTTDGVTLAPTFHVDESVLGGFAVVIGDESYDFSAKRAIEARLEKYKDSNKQVQFSI